MINLCAPAIVYLIFSITQVLIDIYKGLYNTAFMKVIVSVMVTLLLNILCERGLNGVSWIIVFIPFILMTVMMGVLLYFFGLNATTGTLDYTCKTPTSSTSSTSSTCTTYPDGISKDVYGNIVVYDPEYNPYYHPVYYHSPNIIVPNPEANNPETVTVQTYQTIPTSTSSPEYQS
jgi:hypothetical protein